MNIPVTLHNTSRTLLFGMCFFLWVGCIPKQTPSHRSVSSLPAIKVPERPLFRGLKTGMKPKDVARVVCLKWSLGKCKALQPVALRRDLRLQGMKSYLSDLKIYRHKEVSELNCDHYFYFRYWGLMAVQVQCRAPRFEPLQSMVRRYQRWFGKPKDTELLGSEHQYEWTKNRNDWRVKLLLRRSSSKAIHLDLRRRWHDIATALEPSIEHSDRRSLQTWTKAPKPVKREVLTVAGTMIDRLKNLHLRKRYFRLYSSPWMGEVSTKKDCQATNTRERWKNKLWSAIGFVPPKNHRLRYRLIQVYHYSKFLSTRAQRNFRIDAEGCGFTFQISLRKLQEDWIFDPIIARSKE
ncbi:MAG: hypothetical protein EP343_32405 [Deltaproteobacteria bacterium]|nr:MAG: hypothetical protein EP343_32405 [Deltaproteobacteria bacterium]